MPGESVGEEEYRDVCDRLRRRGWDAQVRRYCSYGEVDVRLDVRRSGFPAVELLGAYASLPCHDRWQAVRITAECRAVWCGPPRGGAQAEVIGFVEDLLQRDESQLALLYLRLG